MSRRIRRLLVLVLALAAASSAVVEQAEDHRAGQHGIDLIRVGDKPLLVWGGVGNPPQLDLGGDWQHDVFYALLNASAAADAAPIEPRILVSRPEAQEPPSAAINALGTLLMTTEDRNWLVVWQRYPGPTLQAAPGDAAGAVTERRQIIDGLAALRLRRRIRASDCLVCGGGLLR